MAKSKQRSARAQAFLVHDRTTIGIGGLACREELHVAKKAAAACDHERHHDAVALGQCRHGGPDLDDFTHEFVAENVTRFHGRYLAAVHVQVGAADRSGGDFEDDVVGLLDDRIGYGVDLDVVTTVIGEGAHGVNSLIGLKGDSKLSRKCCRACQLESNSKVGVQAGTACRSRPRDNAVLQDGVAILTAAALSHLNLKMCYDKSIITRNQMIVTVSKVQDQIRRLQVLSQ